MPLTLTENCQKEGGEKLKRDDKEILVKDLHVKLERSRAAILTDFRGLTVEAMNNLRGQLRTANGEYKVVKNSVLSLAAENTATEVLKNELVGPCGVAISYEDPVAIAKVLVDFAKTNPSFALRSGVLQGKLISEESVRTLAKLPAKEVLIAQLMSVMIAPSTGMVQVLSGIVRKLLYALKAIQDQKAAA